MGNHMIIIEAYIEAAKVPAAEGSEGAKAGTDRSLAEVLPRPSCANCKQQVHVPVGTGVKRRGFKLPGQVTVPASRECQRSIKTLGARQESIDMRGTT